MNHLCKIIPSPKSAIADGSFSFHGLGISGDFKEAAESFIYYAQKALSLEFTEGEDILISTDSSMEKGEYSLIVSDGAITASAADSEGANHALASLLQLAENKNGRLYVENITLRDKADSSYRGCMIDCARNSHPLKNLIHYVDMCWLYKLSHLHLHFTDNEAYTLPSKLFPKLTTKHNSYTEEEIAVLVKYAHSRGVQLVPEIDTPGHSDIIRSAYPEIFGHKGIICFHEKSIEAMQALYGELCEMFPYSEYIHIGADESELMDWNNCPECISYGEDIGININEIPEYFWPRWHRVERFLAHYINKMAEAVIENGRKPLVWEGFSKEVNQFVTRDVTVMVFESFYQTAASLIRNGFNVINCSWRPTYVVVPKHFWGREECYNWTVGSFSAVHPDSPYYNGQYKMDTFEGVLGGQLNSWGDFLGEIENGLQYELEKILEDAPCIAENTWNHQKAEDYQHFLISCQNCTKIFNKITED